MADTSFFARAQFAQIRGLNGNPHFRARILRNDGPTFSVAMPPSTVKVTAGQPVTVVVPTPLGLYQFETTVAQISTSPAAVVLRAPQHIEHSQRREFARSPIRVEAMLRYAFPPGSARGAPVTALCHTMDLSAGGVRAEVESFSPPFAPEPDTDGEIEFRTSPVDAPCRCRVKVLRVSRDSRPGNLVFAGEFFGLPDAERDRITRKVLAHQAELRRTGQL